MYSKKNKYAKKFFIKLIVLSPFNFVRVMIYRYFFNYEIGSNVKIGKSIIDVERARIEDHAVIRDNTRIYCKEIHIGSHTTIHSDNIIRGRSKFSIGNNSRIINDHTIDLWSDVTIGNHSWLAGRYSQIWTHGSIHTKTRTKDFSVTIGDYVYVGSNVLIAPGVSIGDVNLIGMGSVVTRSVNSSKSIIAGNPAVVVKENIDWRENW